jgi:hypothetical protein
MVTEIRIYFEGDDALRPGFRRFLNQIAEKARSRKCKFNLIAANGTPAEDYRDAIGAHPDAWNILPRDSEGAIANHPSEHADSIFWMVQFMESWFLADLSAWHDTTVLDFERVRLRAILEWRRSRKRMCFRGSKPQRREPRRGSTTRQPTLHICSKGSTPNSSKPRPPTASVCSTCS